VNMVLVMYLNRVLGLLDTVRGSWIGLGPPLRKGLAPLDWVRSTLPERVAVT